MASRLLWRTKRPLDAGEIRTLLSLFAEEHDSSAATLAWNVPQCCLELVGVNEEESPSLIIGVSVAGHVRGCCEVEPETAFGREVKMLLEEASKRLIGKLEVWSEPTGKR